MQVRLHQLEHHEDVLKLTRTGRQHDVFNFHDICSHFSLSGIAYYAVHALLKQSYYISWQSSGEHEEVEPLKAIQYLYHLPSYCSSPGCRSSRSSLISLSMRVASET